MPTQSNIPPKSFTGARALVSMNGQTIGIFTTVSYSWAYDLAAIYILGRFSAAELVHSGAEVVNLNCSGFRIVGHGPFVDGQMPALQDLLTTGYFEFVLVDRETGQRIMRVSSCKATSFSMNVAAKSVADFSMTYQGLVASDETVTNVEAAGAADLP